MMSGRMAAIGDFEFGVALVMLELYKFT